MQISFRAENRSVEAVLTDTNVHDYTSEHYCEYQLSAHAASTVDHSYSARTDFSGQNLTSADVRF